MNKKYMRAYQREWVRKRKIEFFTDKKCEFCGEDNPNVLEMDHIIPRSISGRKKHTWSWSINHLEKELNEHCRTLCKTCHKKRHDDEKRKPIKKQTILSKNPPKIIDKRTNIFYPINEENDVPF